MGPKSCSMRNGEAMNHITNGREYTSAEWLAEMRAMETEDCCELDSEIVPPPPVAADASPAAAPTPSIRPAQLAALLYGQCDSEEDEITGVEIFV